MSTIDRTPAQAAVSGAVLLTVVLLRVVTPFATDMYVPGFPQAMRDLAATASEVQLTLTTFFVGMGWANWWEAPSPTRSDAGVRFWSGRLSGPP